MFKRLQVLFALVFILSSCTNKPEKRIEFTVPESYIKVFDLHEKGAFDIEFVPEGESLEEWTQIVRYIYQPVSVDLREQFSQIVNALVKSCPEAYAPNPFLGKIAGYNALNGLFACGKREGLAYGEITQYIFIHDEDGVHSLQRGKRIKEFTAKQAPKIIKAELKEWDSFFKALKFE